MKESNNANYFIRDGVLYKSCPSCSKKVNKDVFYECPKFFGFRECFYSQSECSKCRSRNTMGPFLGYIFQEEDKLIPEVRILPMSKNEFLDFDKCREFLIDILPSNGNKFYYKKHNMITQSNALILFQYNAEIVAYGFYETEKEDIDGEYNGYYKFFDNSIVFLNNPITSSEMKDLFNIQLCQGTTNVALNYLPKIFEMLMKNRNYVNNLYDYDQSLFNIQKELEQLSQRKIFTLNEEITLSEIDLDIVGFGEVDRTIINDIGETPNYAIKFIEDTINAYDGKVIEDYIFNYEYNKLKDILSESELSEMIRFYSSRKDRYGFDILSFELQDGKYVKKYIEVKSTSKNERTPIDITANELQFAKEHMNNYYIYRVIIVDSSNLKLSVITGKELFKKYDLVPTKYKIYSKVDY